MLREIRNPIYVVHVFCSKHIFVECETKDELYRYVARLRKNKIVMSAKEIMQDGTHVNVNVLTNKRYKEIARTV